MTTDTRLLQQAVNLATLPEDTLLQVLGLQLLAIESPGTTVGIATYLSNTATMAKTAVQLEASEALLPASVSGIAEILKNSRERAENYLQSIKPKLRQALCKDGKLHENIEENIDKSETLIKMLTELISSGLQLPPILGSIAVTIAAWLCKTGVRQFCL